MKEFGKSPSAVRISKAALRLSGFFTDLSHRFSRKWGDRDGRRSFFGAVVQAALLLCFCGVLAGGALLTVNLSMLRTTTPKITTLEALSVGGTEGKPFDCILVLGAGVREDGSPSSMLYDRVVTACSIYELLNGLSERADVPLLMSGDHTGDYNEVGVMKRLAVERGIPSEQVFLDHEGYSTYESVYRAKYVFGARKLLIITQGYHLHRALHIARELGMEAVGVSADLRPYRKQRIYETREYLARFKDMLAAARGGYNGHLDLPVDLKGDGNVTD